MSPVSNDVAKAVNGPLAWVRSDRHELLGEQLGPSASSASIA